MSIVSNSMGISTLWHIIKPSGSSSFFLLCVALIIWFSGNLLEPALKKLQNKIHSGWMNQKPYREMFPGMFALAVSCHFYRLANFPLSIDDELSAFRSEPSVWIGQGRWTIFWMENLLFKQPTLPFLPDAFFCLTITAAYLLILKSHGVHAKIASYLTFPIFCAFPVLTVLGEFYANLPSLGFGFLLCGIAAVFANHDFRQSSKKTCAFICFLQSLCIGASIGCYQPFILVFVVTCIGSLLLEMAANLSFNRRAFFRKLTLHLLQSIAGTLAYRLIHLAHLHFIPSDQSYIQSTTDLQQLIHSPHQVLSIFFDRMYAIYSGSSSIFGTSLSAFPWLMIFGFLGMMTYCRPLIHTLHFSATFLLCSSLLIVPGALTLLSGGHMPLRTYIAIPYTVWFFSFFAFHQKKVVLSWLGGLATALAVFQVFHLNCLYAAEMTIAQQYDHHFAAKIYRSLEQTNENFSLSQHYKIDIYGMMPPRTAIYPSDASSTTGGSFFNWDQGNTTRMVKFMNLIGYSNIEEVTKEERKQLVSTFKEMPTWPKAGSVLWSGNTALVKLSAQPGILHTTK